LTGPLSGKGAPGKWTDAATGEHGDLLDLIGLTQGLDGMGEILGEARSFLNLPPLVASPDQGKKQPSSRSRTPDAARRLFAISQPISGTIAETYLQYRGIHALHGVGALRFHPRCYFRQNTSSPYQTWPALIAAVTDFEGTITGVHRTWLDPSGRDKAPVETPRRAMGDLLGNAVRFGVARDVLATGEGIETMLSLRCALPALPMVAALSAAHLAAILFPVGLRRLYIARDADPAGDSAVAQLLSRTREAGIEALVLSPQLGDFNEDLSKLGLRELRAAVRVQLAPEDVVRFMGS
jgi:hypothetical protein